MGKKKGRPISPGQLLRLHDSIEIADFNFRCQEVFDEPDLFDLEDDGVFFKKGTAATYLGVLLAWKETPIARILIGGKVASIMFDELFEHFRLG